MTQNLYELFRSRFPADRQSMFIETPEGKVYSYADAEAVSARLAHALVADGVSPGDRVAVQVDKSPEAVLLYLACLRAGAVYLPLNTAYQSGEIDYFMQDAEPTVFVCRPEAADPVRDLAVKNGVPHVHTLDQAGGGSLIEAAAGRSETFDTVAREADDLAAILYTSGTTGRPKGAMLTHDNLGSNGLALHEAWGWEPGDVLLHILPIFHTHGLFVAIHCVLLNGSGMIFLNKFDPKEIIRLMPRATVMMGVPTHYVRLLKEDEFTSEVAKNMRLFTSGSAPLLVETFEDFRARTGQNILERCGMTETGMNTSNPLNGERLAGTVGTPLPRVEVRIVDDAGEVLPDGETGMLEVRGPNVFKGYWRNPEKTAEEFRDDGFFITGDMARIDPANGYMSIVGREKDLIISGGFNVYPKEIELLIDDIPGVNESAVVGVPHPDFGEAVTAVIVRRPDGEDLTEENVISTIKGQLANFKVPKKVTFVDELPRNAMGKVQKNVLRDELKESFAD